MEKNVESASNKNLLPYLTSDKAYIRNMTFNLSLLIALGTAIYYARNRYVDNAVRILTTSSTLLLIGALFTEKLRRQEAAQKVEDETSSSGAFDAQLLKPPFDLLAMSIPEKYSSFVKASRAHKLPILDFSHQEIEIDLTSLMQISQPFELDLSDNLWVADHHLEEHLAKVPKLFALKLSNCPNITEKGFCSLAASASIEELDLSHNLKELSQEKTKNASSKGTTDKINWDKVEGLEGFKSLRLLNLTNRSCKNSDIDGLVDDIPSLKHLNLSYCSRITEELINSINDSKIEELILAHCSKFKITDASIKQLSDMPLKKLDLRGCLSICQAQEEVKSAFFNRYSLKIKGEVFLSFEGYKYFEDFKHLEELYLDCGLLDKDLIGHLQSIKTLKRLYIDQNQATAISQVEILNTLNIESVILIDASKRLKHTVALFENGEYAQKIKFIDSAPLSAEELQFDEKSLNSALQTLKKINEGAHSDT